MSFKRFQRCQAARHAARRARPALFVFALLTVGASAQTTPAPQTSPGEAESLNARVVQLAAEGKYEEALPLARRVLELRSREGGGAHPAVALAHMNLAVIQQKLRDYDGAQSSYKRALSIYEKGGDEYAPQAAKALDALARLAARKDDAVSLHERSLKLKEKTSGPRSVEVAATLFRLGHIRDIQGEHGKAEEYFKRFVEISEGAKLADDAAVGLLRLGCLVRKRGKDGEAAELERRADGIFQNSLDERFQLVEDDVIKGKALSKPGPRYPVEARNLRAQGTIQVSVLVGEAGEVLAACGEGGHRLLEEAAEHAAYAARFAPTTLRGRPVKVRGRIFYNFVIQ